MLPPEEKFGLRFVVKLKDFQFKLSAESDGQNKTKHVHNHLLSRGEGVKVRLGYQVFKKLRRVVASSLKPCINSYSIAVFLFLFQLEPFFLTLALFDAQQGVKLSEDFHVDVNSDPLREMLPLPPNTMDTGPHPLSKYLNSTVEVSLGTFTKIFVIMH